MIRFRLDLVKLGILDSKNPQTLSHSPSFNVSYPFPPEGCPEPKIITSQINHMLIEGSQALVARVENNRQPDYSINLNLMGDLSETFSSINDEIEDAEWYFIKLDDRDYCDSIQDTFTRLKENMDSDFSIFNQNFAEIPGLVNDYALSPSLDRLHPLLKQSPFFQQIHEGFQDKVVNEFFVLLQQMDLMDGFTALFQSYSFIGNGSAEFNLAFGYILTQLDPNHFGLLTATMEKQVTLIAGLLGWLSPNMYFVPGVLLISPDIFTSLYVSFHQIRSTPLPYIYASDKYSFLQYFGKQVVDSFKKTNRILARSLLSCETLGLLKSQPWYAKYLSWFKHPNAFKLVVEVEKTNISFSTFGRTCSFSIDWGVVGASVGGIVLAFLAVALTR